MKFIKKYKKNFYGLVNWGEYWKNIFYVELS